VHAEGDLAGFRDVGTEAPSQSSLVGNHTINALDPDMPNPCRQISVKNVSLQTHVHLPNESITRVQNTADTAAQTDNDAQQVGHDGNQGENSAASS